MLSIMKIILTITLMSFSVSASAYAYMDKGSKGDYWAGDSLKDSKKVTKKQWKAQWKQQWSKKSNDKKYKRKVSGVDTKYFLDKLKKTHARNDNKYDFSMDKYKYKKDRKHDKPEHNVPEPGIVGLLAIGLLGMVARRRFKA